MTIPLIPENLENLPKLRELLNAFRDAVLNNGAEVDPIFLAQRGAPNGVATLDENSRVPLIELGSGTPSITTFLRGDGSWATIEAGSGGAKAATIVVDPGGEGDVTTLAAAIAALPADGGYIYMREGTYTISAQQVLPNKNIVIIGSGIDSTVINFTGTGTFLSQANDGVYFTIKNLKLDGGEINTAQKVFVATGEEVEVYFESVEIEGFNHIVDDTGGTDNTFTFTNVEMDLPAFDLTSSFYKGVSTGTVIWNYTSVTLAEASRISGGGGAFLGSPKWVATHSYIGGPPPSAISDFVIGQAIFDGLRADKIKFIISGDKSQIYALESVDCVIALSGSDFFLSHSYFKRQAGVGFENAFLNADAPSDEIHIVDSTFDGGGSLVDAIILTSPTHITVTGCRFKNFTVTSMYIAAAATGVVSHNTFTNAGTPVTEASASATMTYEANNGFTGSSIAGADSVVDGTRRKDVVGGTTTNAFVDQFTHLNTKGMVGGGSLKNTGGSNTLTIRLTATDAFDVTDTQETEVLPGAAATWSMASAVGTSLAPYVSYKVAVKSTSSGNHTTFTLHHASAGAY